MFQFRRFPSYDYFIHHRIPFGGFPHSEISGSKLICSSPKLIAAYHVLHRLLMPRHSPCALISLTYVRSYLTQSTHRQSIWFSLSWIMQAHKRSFLAKNCILPFLIKSFPLLLPSHNIASIIKQCSVFKVHLVLFSALRMLTSVSPAPLRFRLLNLFCKKLNETSKFLSLLQSVSYMVESTGIEPVTSCLQGRRSPSWANPPYLRSGGPKWTRTIDLTIISRVL